MTADAKLTDAPTETPTARTSRATPTTLPDGIESAEGKLVYLALATTGTCEVRDLAASLDVPHITLYGVLDTLASRGLVKRVGTSRFAPA